MHQYLFFIGNWPIRFYGIFFSLGIISGCIMAYFLLKKENKEWAKHIFDLGITIAFWGILGGRLWDVFFFDWEYYHNHLSEIFYVWQGGMAIQGGVLLGAIAGIYYLKKHNIDPWAFADLFAPALMVGQSVGRMANLMNGDAFGHPTGGNYGIIYPETTLAYRTYGNQPLWPAEIWEGQIDIIIFVILLLANVFPHKKGQIFCLYAFLYSGLRFFLEFLRGDYVNLTLGFKSAQVTSLIVMAISFGIWLYLHYKGTTDTHVFPTVKGKKQK